jgi:hypothetical protein
MSLDRTQVGVLKHSADALEAREVKPYFELKAHLSKQPMRDRREFEKDYCRFYGLNIAGLTEGFQRSYFDALYLAKPGVEGWPDYPALLRKLHAIPNRRGKATLQSSFVSKLVASRDESWPLYDRHVANFFGVFVPSTGSVTFRAQVLISHLEFIRQRYATWSKNDLATTLALLKTRIPELRGCQDIRICDFLVWRAGNKKMTAGVE